MLRYSCAFQLHLVPATMQVPLEKDDEELEKLLGEIPTATSGPSSSEETLTVAEESSKPQCMSLPSNIELYHTFQNSKASFPNSFGDMLFGKTGTRNPIHSPQHQPNMDPKLNHNINTSIQQNHDESLSKTFAEFNLKDNVLKRNVQTGLARDAGIDGSNGEDLYLHYDVTPPSAIDHIRVLGSPNSHVFSIENSSAVIPSLRHSYLQRSLNDCFSTNNVMNVDSYTVNSSRERSILPLHHMNPSGDLRRPFQVLPACSVPQIDFQNFQTVPGLCLPKTDFHSPTSSLPHHQYHRNSCLQNQPNQSQLYATGLQPQTERIQMLQWGVEEDNYRRMHQQYPLFQQPQIQTAGTATTQTTSNLTGHFLNQSFRHQSIHPSSPFSKQEGSICSNYGVQCFEAGNDNAVAVHAANSQFCITGNYPSSPVQAPFTPHCQNNISPKSYTKKSIGITGVNAQEKWTFPEKILTRNHLKGVTTITTLIPNSREGNSPAVSFQLDNEMHSKEKPIEKLRSDSSKASSGSQLLAHLKHNSLDDLQGQIYYLARDQYGCRFLQKKFEGGNPEDIQKIFVEIVDHIIELMTDPFGNYLVQKLLEVCNGNQKMQIILAITRRPGVLVKISQNMHGTRAVQKLIERLETPDQVSIVVSSLKPGIVSLIKDLNGNHVVQRCLQCLINKDAEFLFDAAAVHCVEIATHRHGCCVLQRCVDYATGAQHRRLIAEVAANSLVLSQDPFGNYVVQYILDLRIAWATNVVMNQLEGNFANLSMQKFSSNVVEKCLQLATEEKRVCIIQELITSPQLRHLLQDPFANYVIQSALSAAKGSLHAAFIEAIHPHLSALRSSPFGRRILSRTNLKK